MLRKRDWEKSLQGAHVASDKVFSFSDKQNVYRSLRGACKRAGVPYHSTHPAGRHTFGKRILRAGHSLKLLQEAGGWNSIRMPAENYGHLETSHVRGAVLDLAGENPGKKRRKVK
jgi:site-specific recombinase XerD